jgi:hypothetical protein
MLEKEMPPDLMGEVGGGAEVISEYHNFTPDGAGSQGCFAELTPFEQSEALPPFPSSALPPAACEFVCAATETVQAPVDMVGACVLGMLEIACRGRFPVRLPNGHIERPCLYVAPIAPPSERKSGVIDVVARPLIDYEIEYNREHNGEVGQSQSELRLLQGRIASAEQTAIKTKDAEARRIAGLELQGLNTELAEFEPIEPLRLYGADVTPEKLAAMLRTQRGTFALVSAEGGGLFENIGRYNDRGGLEIYLSGYSGDRVCVDRKGSASIVVDRPALNMIAPCQPSVIADLFSDRQKSGRGLLSRILFVKCPSRVGGRSATSVPLNERIAADYRNLCFNMLAAQNNGNNGNLEFDKGGFDVYRSFFDEIEPQLTPDIGELSFMADWAGKLPGQMARLAGLIHCIAAFERGNNPHDTQINAEETRAAVELARYFLAHAKAVYAEQAEPESVSNARYLWGKIKAMKTDKKNELSHSTQGKQNFSLDDSLAELVNRGYIRVEYTRTGGRPSPRIVVNPETQNICTKGIKALANTPFVPFVHIPPNVPDIAAASEFTDVTAVEDGDLPW